MKQFVFNAMMLCLLGSPTVGRITAEELQISQKSEYKFNVGAARVDITPKEEITLAGSPSPKKTSSMDTPLYAKAMVISAGEQKLAIVTLDTLKYPTEFAVKARKQIEEATGIPAANIIICASHTHRGPLWVYYRDRLIKPITQAVVLAVEHLEPCKIGTAKGIAKGVSVNRRLLKDGEVWNRWFLPPSERDQYPTEGPADPEVGVLAAVGRDGKYKAILYNFASHPVSTRGNLISADYPGHVQRFVEDYLGYEVPTLFLLGSSGDVTTSASGAIVGSKVGEGVLASLEKIEFIDQPTLRIVNREEEIPVREYPEFQEKEVALKWPNNLEHYRKAFEAMKQRQEPVYKCLFTGFRIGDDFAIVTNPFELFCGIGINIKNGSPFKNTMVATLTNGARGYVPTRKAFEGRGRGYETWYGEHSFLTKRAGDVTGIVSQNLLKQLQNEE